MRKLDVISKVCYCLGFLGTVGSIIVSLYSGKEVSWQLISLSWMGSAFISDLRIKQLEDKQ